MKNIFIDKMGRASTVLEIAFLFIAPVLLLYIGAIPEKMYLFVSFIYTVFVLLIFQNRWTLKTLQIRLDNLKVCALPYIIFTTVGIGILVALAALLDKERIPYGTLYLIFISWSLPISFIQELLYRGFLIHELRRVYASTTAVIVTNAALFAFLHIIYPQAFVILPLMFAGGIAFAWMYTRYPNLLLISLSHSALNIAAIGLGFFSI